MSARIPRKLITHLRNQRNLKVTEQSEGIYYIEGEIFPIRILCTARLPESENIWLKCLTMKLSDTGLGNRLLEEYKGKENVETYSAAMDAIMRANQQFFKGGEEDMCKALDELLQPRLEQAVEQTREQMTEQMTMQKDKEKKREIEKLKRTIRKNLQGLGLSEEQIAQAFMGRVKAV